MPQREIDQFDEFAFTAEGERLAIDHNDRTFSYAGSVHPSRLRKALGMPGRTGAAVTGLVLGMTMGVGGTFTVASYNTTETSTATPHDTITESSPTDEESSAAEAATTPTEAAIAQPEPITPITPSTSPSPSPSESPTASASPSESAQKPIDCLRALPIKTLVGQSLVLPVNDKNLGERRTVYNQNRIGGILVRKADGVPNEKQLQSFNAAQSIEPVVVRGASEEHSAFKPETALQAWVNGEETVTFEVPNRMVPNLTKSISYLVGSTQEALESGELDSASFYDSRLNIFEAKKLDPCNIPDTGAVQPIASEKPSPGQQVEGGAEQPKVSNVPSPSPSVQGTPAVKPRP